MSVKVHEPVCEDSAQDLYFWFDHFLGDQIQDEWHIVVVAGSINVVDAQTGGIIRLLTAAAVNDNSRIHWQDVRSLHATKKVTMEIRAKLTQTTNQEIYLMLWFDWSNRINFQHDTNVGVNWYIECDNGGALTTLDSGIAADTDYHIFRIECFPTDEVHFYIDGVETANSPITTNIPDDAGDFLQPYLYILTRENATKSIDIDYCVVRQER